MVWHEMFKKDTLEHIGEMRARFFATGSADDITGVRPEILECWKLAYAAGLDTSNTDKPRLSAEEFCRVKERSQQLLDIAVPYMEVLCGFLKEDNFWVTLVDHEGVILKIVGSEKAVALANQTNLYEGSFRGLNVDYVGLFQACWHYNKPFQIVSTEHSTAIDDQLAGAASPIIDKKTGERLGIIGISGYWWESHTHTLGLAIMTAEAISQQISLCRQNEQILSVNQKLDTALEATSIGIVYFEQNGTILAVNNLAMDLLQRTIQNKKEFMEKSIFFYLAGALSETDIPEVQAEINDHQEYVFEFTPPQKYNVLCCLIRAIPQERGTYIMQVQKRSDLTRIAADSAVSKAVFTLDDIVGTSDQIAAVKDAARVAAKYSPATLILGESGTGKELFAQAIHNASARAKGPFVAVNCGAIPKALLESELFGYEAGSFTGASRNGKPGKFELANGGTLFLDEIGDMLFEAQVSLLRVLQTKEVIRVGGKKPIKVDLMVIAATNQNLEQHVQDRTFREDLYYRLNVFTLQIPPLRERAGDVEQMSGYFLRKYSRSFDKRFDGIQPAALAAMAAYRWPGNVRELENAMERAVIICQGSSIGLQDLPAAVQAAAQLQGAAHTVQPMDELNMKDSAVNLESPGVKAKPFADSPGRDSNGEAETLRKMLKEHKGNLSKIARLLQISRPTLYRKLKKYGLYEKLHAFD